MVIGSLDPPGFLEIYFRGLCCSFTHAEVHCLREPTAACRTDGGPLMRVLSPHFQGMSVTSLPHIDPLRLMVREPFTRKGLFSHLLSQGPRWVPGRRSRNQGAHAAMAVKFKANSTGLSGFVGNMRRRPERVSLPPLRTLPFQLCSTCLGIIHSVATLGHDTFVFC